MNVDCGKIIHRAGSNVGLVLRYPLEYLRDTVVVRCHPGDGLLAGNLRRWLVSILTSWYRPTRIQSNRAVGGWRQESQPWLWWWRLSAWSGG